MRKPTTREMLDAAIEALVPGPADATCPFLPGRPLYDALHVDAQDPECYSEVALDELELEEYLAGGADDACRACVREQLEELAIAAKEES